MSSNLKFFAPEPVNFGNQQEFDLSRAIACVLMVFCHVGIYFFSETDHPNLFMAADMLGGEFTAPVFMALLGANLSFSRNSSPSRLARRGVQILMIGFLLNFVRRSIPCWFLLRHGITPPESFPAHPILDVDILQFAALALLALALVKRLSIPALTVFLGSIPLVVIGESLWGIHPGNPIGDFLCNLLWCGTHQSYFPFLHWFFFTAFGYLFGEILTHCSNKDALYRRIILPALASVLLAYTLILKNGEAAYYYQGNYYSMGLREVVLATGFILFSLSASNFLFRKIRDGILRRAIIRYSRNLTSIYCISWVLIFTLLAGGLYKGHNFTVWETIGLMPIVLLVSDGLAMLYKKAKAQVQRRP